MTGKILVTLILIAAAAVGIGVYYTQVHAYYEEVATAEADGILLTSLETGQPERIAARDIAAIDAFSSPIRYRACFTTTLSQDELAAAYVPYPDAEPLTGPGWFSCFDADAIGDGLSAGTLTGWLGTENIVHGIDRVVALGADGRGYVWHQINRCGEQVFDGKPAPEGCPPKPE